MPVMTTLRRTGRRRSPKSLALAALLAGALAAVPSPGGAAPTGTVAPLAERRPVCIRGTCFDAEIAVTAFERGRGLMFRDSLAKDRGMLFVFPEEGQHLFWMKNTKIELDMIFIGADQKVVGFSHRAKPCTADPCDRYGPEGASAYVLEIAGGLAATYGFAKGDRVEFRGVPAGK
jgi:uncharacterized membrane protein (UPF0127 family)